MSEYVYFNSEEFKNRIRKKMTLTSLAWYLHPSSATAEDAWRDYLRYWFKRGYMTKEMYGLIEDILDGRLGDY